MANTGFQLLFYILQSEQTIISRTDQKAYTLLSVLGVFMVFFIVYFRLLAVNLFIIALLPVYFIAAFLTIWNLINTIQPRLHTERNTDDQQEQQMVPTFFGGIREFSTSEDYYQFMQGVVDDEQHVLRLLSRQVHAVANINWDKNKRLNRGVYFFVLAIGTELVIILSTFLKKGLEAIAG